MSVYPIPDLKDRIDLYIKTNGVKAITGALLNTILNDTVDSLEDYTDDEIANAVADLVSNTALTSALANYLLKSGGTMTGNLDMQSFQLLVNQIKAAAGLLYFVNAGNNALINDITALSTNRTITWRNLAGTPAFLDDIKKYYFFAGSDETTDLQVSISPCFTDYMPYSLTVSSVMINVNTAPTGANLIVDIKKNGTSIFTTLISIDATENTSLTATTPYVLDGAITFAQGDKIEAFINQVGSTIKGNGLKIKLLG